MALAAGTASGSRMRSSGGMTRLISARWGSAGLLLAPGEVTVLVAAGCPDGSGAAGATSASPIREGSMLSLAGEGSAGRMEVGDSWAGASVPGRSGVASRALSVGWDAT